MAQARILVVDDDAAVRESLESILQYHGFDAKIASSGAEALDILGRGEVALALVDVKMSGMDGMELLGRLRAGWPSLPVVLVSGHGDIQTAVEAVRRGAEDFLEKPLDENRLLVVVKNALRRQDLENEKHALELENRSLRGELEREFAWHGSSATSQALIAAARRLAQAGSARILIVGESGTGKELLARRIHHASPRRAGPFEVFACASQAPELVDDALFGHAAGAFSGARSDRAGVFERAHGGTLLLDEIAELPLDTQAKLLRVLETRTFRRLGESVERRTDVAVIATTQHDLAAEAASGRFRKDLYYRVNAPSLRIPPLRERPQDIPELANAFLDRIARETRRPRANLDKDAMTTLTDHAWPGNARELRNTLEALELVKPDRVLRGEDVREFLRVREAGVPLNPFDAPSFDAFREAADRLYLTRQLARHGGNVKKTAEALGLFRTDLYRRLHRLGLRTRTRDEGPDEPPGEET